MKSAATSFIVSFLFVCATLWGAPGRISILAERHNLPKCLEERARAFSAAAESKQVLAIENAIADIAPENELALTKLKLIQAGGEAKTDLGLVRGLETSTSFLPVLFLEGRVSLVRTATGAKNAASVRQLCEGFYLRLDYVSPLSQIWREWNAEKNPFGKYAPFLGDRKQDAVAYLEKINRTVKSRAYRKLVENYVGKEDEKFERELAPLCENLMGDANKILWYYFLNRELSDRYLALLKTREVRKTYQSPDEIDLIAPKIDGRVSAFEIEALTGNKNDSATEENREAWVKWQWAVFEKIWLQSRTRDMVSQAKKLIQTFPEKDFVFNIGLSHLTAFREQLQKALGPDVTIHENRCEE